MRQGATAREVRRARRLPLLSSHWRDRLGERAPFLAQLIPEVSAAVAPVPERAPGHLRLFTLNMAHGRRQVSHQALVRRHATQRNLLEIARALRQVEADVVALQEADGPSAWSGNFDHVATLAELAELHQHYRGEHNPFGVGRFNLASGTALLSRHPLGEPASHRFATSWGDTKGFVVATVPIAAWDDLSLDVVSVHLDFLVPSVRRRQIRHMVEVLRGRGNPLVVLGDLNCCWHSEPRSMELLTRTLRLEAYEPDLEFPTYPATRPRRRLDWILASPELRFRGYHRLPDPLSDHLGVVADLELG